MADILQEQMAYYRARAAEYDEWFYRHGRYDRGEEANAQWFAELDIVRNALHNLKPVDSALELASGTGIWTGELLKLAQHITALDAAQEMHAINRSKHPEAMIDFQQVDLFEWSPETTYDLVFFAYWLSHVPPEKLDAFLEKVYQATKPGGKVFMIDSRLNVYSSAANHPEPDLDNHTHTRLLNDGQTYTIYKIFYEVDALTEAFHKAGFSPKVQITDNYVIYVEATK